MEIRAEKLHKMFGKDIVLDDISFVVETGQKIGVVGYNGTGKSTLLKILAGVIEPDDGKLEKREGITIGYAPQDMSLIEKGNVKDSILRSVGHKVEDYKIEIILSGLGLREVSLSTDIGKLSSGQKEKIFLAGILLKEPDVLLLDEPTNNLDFTTLIWLEKFLKKSKSACLIVSHDRVFLNNIVDKIFEIDWQKRNLSITGGKYSDYLKAKKKEFERLRSEYEEQQKEFQRLSGLIKEKQLAVAKGSKWEGSDKDKYLRGFKRDRASASGRKVKSAKKKVEKLQREEKKKPVGREVFRIDIVPEKTFGNNDIILDEVVIGYEDGMKIKPISLRILFGNRIALLGDNGSGKTTFLKTLEGTIPLLSGNIQKGSSLIIGNLMQEHDNLPKDETLLNFLSEKTSLSCQEVYSLVVKFGFRPEEIDKKLIDFSPGSRSRILFALFSAMSVNVLLLDEPTNHLDLEALAALEEMISSYKGTIVLVSHDRYFLEKFNPSDIFLLDEGKFTKIQSYKNYLKEAKKKAKQLTHFL